MLALLDLLAWVAVALYPVGMLILNGVLLFRARLAIKTMQHTQLSRALEFLYCEYEPNFWWWEVRPGT